MLKKIHIEHENSFVLTGDMSGKHDEKEFRRY